MRPLLQPAQVAPDAQFALDQIKQKSAEVCGHKFTRRFLKRQTGVPGS